MLFLEVEYSGAVVLSPPLILHSQTTSLHKETNILYTGIMIEDLGVHIGVYQP